MSKQILVDKDALFQVLRALDGEPHLLREMIYLRKCDDTLKSLHDSENPIDTLVRNYETSKTN